MGSFPSADLVYGIDLGLYEEAEYSWYTDEMEAEHGDPGEALDRILRGIEGIGYAVYGNFVSGYAGLALTTQSIGARAYEARHVDIATLTGTVGDDDKLRVAWAKLHPDTLMPEPGWFIVVSYG